MLRILARLLAVGALGWIIGFLLGTLIVRTAGAQEEVRTYQVLGQASALAGQPLEVKLDYSAVKYDLDVLASYSETLNIEGLRCIPGWTASRDAASGQVTIHLTRFAPGEVAYATDRFVAVYPTLNTNGVPAYEFCGNNQATVHTHLPINGGGPYLPSDTDWNTIEHSDAPFGVVIQVIPKEHIFIPVVYGVKPAAIERALKEAKP